MEIIVAKSAGFCYGVKRAINLAEKTLKIQKGCYTLGPIIHNPQVVEEFRGKGLNVVDNAAEIGAGTVIIRSHGISKEENRLLKKNKRVKIVDTTCPFVTKARMFLKILKKEGYSIFYLGDGTHPEVKGLLSYIDNDATVFLSPDELDAKGHKKVGLISQTTQKIDLLKKAADRLLQGAEELRIFNTICKTTTVRQKEAVELARKVDLMLVLGGKNSSNTRKLAEICAEVLDKTYHIETVSELKTQWFKGVRKVGITAGASTPKQHITEVMKYISKIHGGGENGKF